MYLYNSLDGLAGKGTKAADAALAAMAAELQQAFTIASMPDATAEQLDVANKLNEKYKATLAAEIARQKKKKSKLLPKLIAIRESHLKMLAKVSPFDKVHAQSVIRREELQKLKVRRQQLQGEKPSKERDDALTSIEARMIQLGQKEKKYLKKGKIVAVIASVIVGIFTFGGGSVAIAGAYEALKQGAIQVAKSILMSAVVSAIAKGATAGDAKKAKQAIADLEKYPPDPNLPSLEAMIADSEMKKQRANKNMLVIGIPAAIAAFTLLA